MGSELKSKSILVGITGGIGAGKSVVSALYAKMGYPVFSADTLAREVVEPGSEALDEIRAAFGPEALLEEGGLNRPWLRSQISQHPELRKKLEAITHPRIQARFRKLAEEAAEVGAKLVFYEAPLLFEAQSENHLDAVITVHAQDEVRIQRVMKRDGGDRELAEKLLASQLPQEEKIGRADYTIENNGSEADLRKAALAVLAEVRKRIGQKPPVNRKKMIALSVGGSVFLVLFFWLLSWDNQRQNTVPEPAIRARAKEILRTASQNLVKAKTGAGFPDDPKAAFEGNPAFSCENCLHYVFALQESCEDGGNLRFYPPSELSLSEDLKGMLTTIRQSMESLSFPCKPAAQGFNLFAAGMASPNSSMDILLVGEDGEPRVIEDGFAASTGVP